MQPSLSKTRKCNSTCVALILFFTDTVLVKQDQRGAIIKTMTNSLSDANLSKASVEPNIFFFSKLHCVNFEILPILLETTEASPEDKALMFTDRTPHSFTYTVVDMKSTAGIYTE